MRPSHLFVCLNAFCLTLLAAGPAFPQTPEATAEKTSTAPVAWVYLQEATGVNLYDAASNGKLTLVNKSPFRTEGAMAGSTGSHLFTTTETSIESYAVESNGAIGSLVSTTNIDKYTASGCGYVAINGTLLDHTGKYLYVNVSSVNGYTTPCVLWQSYKIGSNAELTYLGDLSGVGGSDLTTIRRSGVCRRVSCQLYHQPKDWSHHDHQQL